MGLTEILGSIDWENESYPAYEDFLILPFFALLFPSVRFFLDRFIFEVLSHSSLSLFGSLSFIVFSQALNSIFNLLDY
jgi:hypothetical protein